MDKSEPSGGYGMIVVGIDDEDQRSRKVALQFTRAAVATVTSRRPHTPTERWGTALQNWAASSLEHSGSSLQSPLQQERASTAGGSACPMGSRPRIIFFGDLALG